MPKQITHSIIFLFVAAFLMFFLWIGLGPTKEETSDYVQISNFSFGTLSFREIDQQVIVDSPAFLKITPEQNEKLALFFKNKFLSRQVVDGKNKISLPLNFYDPLCFSQDSQKMKNLSCPITINP